VNVSSDPTWIRIDAPDARSAFALEQRLSHLHPATIGHGDRWFVELEDFDDRADEIEAAVRHWLGVQGLARATMHVGDEVRTVAPPQAAEPPLGAGYDTGRVLDHEP